MTKKRSLFVKKSLCLESLFLVVGLVTMFTSALAQTQWTYGSSQNTGTCAGYTPDSTGAIILTTYVGTSVRAGSQFIIHFTSATSLSGPPIHVDISKVNVSCYGPSFWANSDGTCPNLGTAYLLGPGSALHIPFVTDTSFAGSSSPSTLTVTVKGGFDVTPLQTQGGSVYAIISTLNPSPGSPTLFVANLLFPTLVATVAAACQVSAYTPFGQYQAAPLVNSGGQPITYQAETLKPPPQPSPETPLPVQQYFGLIPVPPPPGNPYVVCPTIVSGCALNGAATMLSSFAELANTTPESLDLTLALSTPPLYDQGDILLCPQGNPSCTTPNVQYPESCELDWPNLVVAYPLTIAMEPGSDQALDSQLYDAYASGGAGGYVPVEQYLNDYACTNHDRVVLQLSETDTNNNSGAKTEPGNHYVFVTGRAGAGDWNVFDPGWDPQNTCDTTANCTSYCNFKQSPPYCSVTSNYLGTYQGHLTGFITNEGTLTRTFTVSGARAFKDITSTGSGGDFTVTGNSPVELLVVDPQGRQLGSLDGADVFEIPGGSYVREYPLADDTGTAAANGDPTGIKTAYIASPEDGTFQVTAAGTALGTYRLTFLAVATDGTIQSALVTGNAGPGTSSSYQTSYSSVPGSAFTVESTTAAAPASGRTCNGTYNGTFVGNVTVSSGQNCIFVGGGITGHVTVTGGSLVLSGATVGNNVQINGAGSFSIGNFSAIKGNLEIQNIPAGVALNQVCGTRVAGNLQFHNNGTPVEIGSASPACPGNTVGGNLEVHNNAAATQIFGNTVNGNLQEHNNTASTQASSNAVGSNMEVNSNTAATQVFSNTVANNLQCQNNTSITGGGNTAKRKQGQCASF